MYLWRLVDTLAVVVARGNVHVAVGLQDAVGGQVLTHLPVPGQPKGHVAGGLNKLFSVYFNGFFSRISLTLITVCQRSLDPIYLVS